MNTNFTYSINGSIINIERTAGYIYITKNDINGIKYFSKIVISNIETVIYYSTHISIFNFNGEDNKITIPGSKEDPQLISKIFDLIINSIKGF